MNDVWSFHGIGFAVCSGIYSCLSTDLCLFSHSPSCGFSTFLRLEWIFTGLDAYRTANIHMQCPLLKLKTKSPPCLSLSIFFMRNVIWSLRMLIKMKKRHCNGTATLFPCGLVIYLPFVEWLLFVIHQLHKTPCYMCRSIENLWMNTRESSKCSTSQDLKRRVDGSFKVPVIGP